jgi:D-proline reductase (dithiol) PrdB
MGDISEFSLGIRLFLKAYPWRRIDPVPWNPVKKPLAQCRLALVTSAGFVGPGQERFDHSIRGGDCSFREIPADLDVRTLIESHRSEVFDHTGIHEDPNLAFPLDRARELAELGRIGSVNRRHLAFMGSITAPGRLIRQTAPPAARLLSEDQVDVALVVPVCPMCNQTMCLVAAELERQGISTVVIQLLRVVAERVRPPRALFVPFKHGYPLDQPNDPQRQHRVIDAALKLLESTSLAPPALLDLVPVRSPNAESQNSRSSP